MNSNKHNSSQVATQSYQKVSSIVKTENEKLSNKGIRHIQIKTGNGEILDISTTSSRELQEVQLVKDSSNSQRPSSRPSRRRSLPQALSTGGPTNFPVTPPSRSHNKPGIPTLTKRTAPPLVTRRARANPAGNAGNAGNGGGDAKFDDQNNGKNKPTETPKLESWNPEYYKKYSNKEKIQEDQCDINQQAEVKESYTKTKALADIAKTTLKKQNAHKYYTDLKEQLASGTDPLTIGRNAKDLGNGCVYIRKGTFRYVVKDGTDVIGISARGDRQNMSAFAKILNDQYSLKIDPNAY